MALDIGVQQQETSEVLKTERCLPIEIKGIPLTSSILPQSG
jgi:hypothetical protein